MDTNFYKFSQNNHIFKRTIEKDCELVGIIIWWSWVLLISSYYIKNWVEIILKAHFVTVPNIRQIYYSNR